MTDKNTYYAAARVPSPAVREPGDPEHMWERDLKVPYTRPGQ